jgi:hypothetical protein
MIIVPASSFRPRLNRVTAIFNRSVNALVENNISLFNRSFLHNGSISIETDYVELMKGLLSN